MTVLWTSDVFNEAAEFVAEGGKNLILIFNRFYIVVRGYSSEYVCGKHTVKEGD